MENVLVGVQFKELREVYTNETYRTVCTDGYPRPTTFIQKTRHLKANERYALKHGLPTVFGTLPRQLLLAGSRAARRKTTASGIPNNFKLHCNFCNIHLIYKCGRTTG